LGAPSRIAPGYIPQDGGYAYNSGKSREGARHSGVAKYALSLQRHRIWQPRRKSHHTLDEKRYGPDFRWLAEVIVDFGLHPTVICETPILDVDARRMQATLKEMLGEKQVAF